MTTAASVYRGHRPKGFQLNGVCLARLARMRTAITLPAARSSSSASAGER